MILYKDSEKDLTTIINEIVSKDTTDSIIIQVESSEHYFYSYANPFLVNAMILHTISGRCDGEFLEEFGGKKDTCPLGERIRTYNKSKELNFIFNPVDQLIDAYKKLVNNQEGVITTYNPYFDSYGENDFNENAFKTPVNAVFSVNNNKLDLIVTLTKTSVSELFNEILGTFRALQTILAGWLGVETGKTHLVVSSVAVNEKPMKYHKHFNLEGADFISNAEETNNFLDILNNSGMIETILDDNFMVTEQTKDILDTLKTIPDPFLRELSISLLIYRAHVLGNVEAMIEGLESVSERLKVKCLRYLYPDYKEDKKFKSLYKDMDENIKRYIEGKRPRAY